MNSVRGQHLAIEYEFAGRQGEFFTITKFFTNTDSAIDWKIPHLLKNLSNVPENYEKLKQFSK